MTEDEKKLLSTFEARLRHLIFLHDELKREHHAVKLTLEEQKDENNKLKQECEAIRKSYTNLKMATAITLNDGDMKEAKQRLSKLVREIDKCIALLNE